MCWYATVVCGPWRTSQGIRIGPVIRPPTWTSLYLGAGASDASNEYGRAFNAELPPSALTAPEYVGRTCGRLLPNARGCANGEAAPLVTLPLMIAVSSGGDSTASDTAGLPADLAEGA